jgi:cell wall-associated NlpC family hydrolase
LPPDSGAPPNPTAEQPAPAIPAAIDPPAVVTALTYRGVPYRDGGSDPSGFDCSGFVQWVFARVGVALPREVREQYRIGTTVERNEIRKGDLVFFQTVAHGASHVGIALDGGTFIHAPSARGVVRIERYTSEYWQQRYVGARRIEQPLPVSGERHRNSD